MKQEESKMRKSRGKFLIPGFVLVAAVSIAGAIISELISDGITNSLNYQIAGFVLMALIALVCLILILIAQSHIEESIAHSLRRIEELIADRNYTRFITSRSERLNLMTDRILKAEKSIYIISDLSESYETNLTEHTDYVKALNHVIKENKDKGNKEFKVKRIVVPSSKARNGAQLDSDWIYRSPLTGAYLAHFKLLREFDEVSPKHIDSPLNVSVILIDNRYLFFKPELSYGEKGHLDSLLDGGIYLEDYTREGIADFDKRFDVIFQHAQVTDLSKFYSTM